MKARLKLVIAGACMAAFIAFAVGCSAHERLVGSEMCIRDRSWEASDSDKTVVLHATVENGAFTQVEEQA